MSGQATLKHVTAVTSWRLAVRSAHACCHSARALSVYLLHALPAGLHLLLSGWQHGVRGRLPAPARRQGVRPLCRPAVPALRADSWRLPAVRGDGVAAGCVSGAGRARVPQRLWGLRQGAMPGGRCGRMAEGASPAAAARPRWLAAPGTPRPHKLHPAGCCRPRLGGIQPQQPLLRLPPPTPRLCSARRTPSALAAPPAALTDAAPAAPPAGGSRAAPACG